MEEIEIKKEDNTPLFKRFWEAKKELISFAGIVVAIGSMFLRMPNPDIVKAADALRMVQFISIFVMSVAIVLLWLSFLSFSYKLENHFSEKSGINLDNTISNVVFMIIFYFLYNLWVYVIALYKNEWQRTMSSLQTAINLFVFAIVFHFVDKIFGIRHTLSKISIILRIIGSGIVGSIIPTIWLYISRLDFDYLSLYKTLIYNFMLYTAFATFYYLFRYYKDKKINK